MAVFGLFVFKYIFMLSSLCFMSQRNELWVISEMLTLERAQRNPDAPQSLTAEHL